jgi:phage tail sheath protein FI
MANLNSPGIQVTVIDESFYTPAAPGSTPIIFVATAENKATPSATGTAQGTLKSNAGDVYVITSQRDLTNTFGTPLFYTDTTGNPIHGDELNEYGLQAAYSLLGISSRAYIVRADIDLAQLKPTTTVPTGQPVAGTYWVNPTESKFGINVWNTATQAFTLVTPHIVNDDNMNTAMNIAGTAPADSFGQQGDYAVVVTGDNNWNQTTPNGVFYKTIAPSNAWVAVAGGFDGGKHVVVSPHTQYPDFTSAGSNSATGSIWIKTTNPGNGANWSVKYYSGSTSQWSNRIAPVYTNTKQALFSLDSAGGGANIAIGTLIVEADIDHNGATTSTNASATFKVRRYSGSGKTNVVSAPSTYTTATQTTFYIRETLVGSNNWGASVQISVPGSNSNPIGAQIPAAISAAGLVNVTASYDATTKKVTLTHKTGGDFQLEDSTGSPIANAGFTAYNYNTTTQLASGSDNLYTAPANDKDGARVYTLMATNWAPMLFKSSATAPASTPADGTLWYNSDFKDVDIMYHNGTTWIGYKNAFPSTDPNGPIVAATAPLEIGGQSLGGNLVTGDIWISTANIDDYGRVIYVWDSATKKWILQDVTDHDSTNGWVFSDARWATGGAASTPSTIVDLLSSNYLDADAPDPALYPRGTRLWNTRRSGNNVKVYRSAYVNTLGTNPRQNSAAMASYFADRWVTSNGTQADGSGNFGRYAQRQQVVEAFKSMINTNTAARDTETLKFNLIACPGYPETIQNMTSFNVDIGQTAFVLGDTPFRLEPTATKLTAWGLGSNKPLDNGEVGAVTYDSYMAMFYPSGLANDNAGNDIVVPPSHMMMNTIVNSDNLSYEWFAPAGLRRGGIINATSVGYVNSTGEFIPVSLYEGLRDVCAQIKVNPITTLTGSGIVNMGQFTRSRTASALDRINVARLVAYLRRQLNTLSKPYLFEPNDTSTRNEIRGAVESLLLELVGQRAINDFVVVCDTTNNTPTRIDRNELYVDIAIEPVKAVEFIYIPLRILNTGAIASGNLGAGFPGSTQ